MIDIELLRKDPDTVRRAVRAKGGQVEDIDVVRELDERRRNVQQKMEEIAHQRNLRVRSTEKKPPARDVSEGKRLKAELQLLEKEFRELDGEFQKKFRRIPNLPSKDTPIGSDASANVVLREKGTPVRPQNTKEHWEIGKRLGIIDTERAAEVSGSRFAYLIGDGVLLEFALVQFALSVLTNASTLEQIARDAGLSVPSTPFVPVLPPVLVRPEVLEKMARLEPKEERYLIQVDDLFLIGSAEHTLGPFHMNEVLPEASLPKRYVGFSPAFRREAGSYGKDVHGILRVHQFDKLELESFTLPEQSRAEQDFFVAIQEHLVSQLELAYRVVLICTGDMGGPDARQVDIEAWFPGQKQYRETHTADLMTDYQARRLHTRVRRENGTVELVHMNDATALAMGRTIAALLETHQQADGTVRIPEALQMYLDGREVLGERSGRTS